MTYYRLDFVNVDGVSRSKTFRTEEHAKQHARKIVGVLEDGSMKSKIHITPVRKKILS
jgi:hypothetical protein